MSDSEGSGAGANDTAAEVAAMLQPLRKSIKKQGSKIDKLDAIIKDAEKRRAEEAEQLQTMATTLAELNSTVVTLKERFEARPWQLDLERQGGELRAAEKRLGGAVDDMKVQLGAHAQVFQSAQASVAQQAHELSGLQAEATETSRRVNEELRSLTTRIDHMRGEFSERVTHTFGESTAHADRLVTRLQQDLLRVEQEVGQRATLASVGESNATQLRELQKLQSAHDELQRTLRNTTTELTDLREQSHGWALKSSLTTAASSSDAKLGVLEEGLARLEQQIGGLTGTMSEGRFGQRQALIESKQLGLERAIKQMEMQLNQTNEDLAQRPLKTDVISAIAQQEVSARASPTRTSNACRAPRTVTCGECRTRREASSLDRWRRVRAPLMAGAGGSAWERVGAGPRMMTPVPPVDDEAVRMMMKRAPRSRSRSSHVPPAACGQMAVEACASVERVAQLEEELHACAGKEAFLALSEAVNSLKERQSEAAGSLSDLRETSATKQALVQRGREIEQLKSKVRRRARRDDGSHSIPPYTTPLHHPLTPSPYTIPLYERPRPASPSCERVLLCDEALPPFPHQ